MDNLTRLQKLSVKAQLRGMKITFRPSDRFLLRDRASGKTVRKFNTIEELERCLVNWDKENA